MYAHNKREYEKWKTAIIFHGGLWNEGLTKKMKLKIKETNHVKIKRSGKEYGYIAGWYNKVK